MTDDPDLILRRPLVWTFLRGGVVFLISVLVCLNPAFVVEGQIAFVEKTVDLGRMAPGQRIPLTLTITNVGSEPVTITNVARSCSCLSLREWSRRLAPGSTGRVDLVFYAPDQVGPVEESIILQGVPGGVDLADLGIVGRVWLPIEAQPGFVSFTTTPPAPVLVRIVSHLESPVTLSEPVSDQRCFRATLTALKPGKEFQLVIEPVPPFPNANVFGRIRLRTNSDLQKEVQISVFLPAASPTSRPSPSSNVTTRTGAVRPTGP